MKRFRILLAIVIAVILSGTADAQIGRRFPSEKKVVTDPVTGTPLTFLTSTPAGDSKIYQTHQQWTSDGQWLIFRSGRARNEAFAVNEKTGDIVQVTESGYTGMLCVARKSMFFYFLRNVPSATTTTPASSGPPQRRGGGALQVMEVNLANVFEDSKAGKMKPATAYQRVCGIIPA